MQKGKLGLTVKRLIRSRPALCWVFFTFCACAWAQQVPSRITLSGSLIDPSDTLVTSVPVRLLSSTSAAEIWTGERGEFQFRNLQPGEYETQVDLEGFEPIRRRVRIGAGSVRNLNLRLILARLKQEFTIEELEHEVNTDTQSNMDAISIERGALDGLPILFFQENFQDRWQENVGVGGTTLKETGVQWRFREDEFIFNHSSTFSPKLLSQFRILLGRYWAPNHSKLHALL
jgi:hypothetical protein